MFDIVIVFTVIILKIQFKKIFLVTVYFKTQIFG
jgi:hypothetical protein